MPASEALLKALMITAEIYAKDMTRAAAEVMVMDLSGYPEPHVLEALGRCRRELRTFPTIADILGRIDDGRPGPDEAFAMLPFDESHTVVWTAEMSEAFGVVRGLSDRTAARMAFRDSYTKHVQAARASRVPTQWTASLGTDRMSREAVVREAVQRGRLTAPEAQNLLPDYSPEAAGDLPGISITKLLQQMPKEGA